jgi:hypothetical protein
MAGRGVIGGGEEETLGLGCGRVQELADNDVLGFVCGCGPSPRASPKLEKGEV